MPPFSVLCGNPGLYMFAGEPMHAAPWVIRKLGFVHDDPASRALYLAKAARLIAKGRVPELNQVGTS